MRTGTEIHPTDPQVSILSHPLNREQKIPPVLTYRPEIRINLLNQDYDVLLDTGASVSAIAENLYNMLRNCPTKNKIPSFPLSGIFLTTATSNKSVKISLQTYLTFKIDNYHTHAVFLVVPKLSAPIILGTDWLLENNVQIKYNTKE